MRIDLLDGNWAELRDDVEHVPHGDRKRVMAAYSIGDGNNLVEQGSRVTEALMTVLVTAWSLDLPLPREKPEVADELAGHDYDVLQHALVQLQKRLYVSFDPTPDPASPMGPSDV